MPRRLNTTPNRNRPTYIRAWRTAKGLSLYDLADMVDATAATISRIETGRGTLTWQALTSIADAMGLEPEQLVFSDPEAPEFDQMVLRIRSAPPEKQAQITRVIDALLTSDE